MHGRNPREHPYNDGMAGGRRGESYSFNVCRSLAKGGGAVLIVVRRRQKTPRGGGGEGGRSPKTTDPRMSTIYRLDGLTEHVGISPTRDNSGGRLGGVYQIPGTRLLLVCKYNAVV